MVFVLIGISAHPVWIGLMLSYFLGYKWDLFPVAGYCDFLYDPQTLEPVRRPTLLGLPPVPAMVHLRAPLRRALRADDPGDVLEVNDEDYVRTAYGKGAERCRVMRKHVLRNALLPVVTMLGMDVGLAFAGAIFIESVFQLPGSGTAALSRAPRRLTYR